MLTRSFHITLAFLLAISSSGLVINKHFCQKQLKSIALFVEAESCHDVSKQKICPVHGTAMPGNAKNDCCENEAEYLQLDIDQQLTTLTYPFFDLNDLFSALPAEPSPLFSADLIQPDYLHLKPPLPAPRSIAWLQVFRL